MSFKFNFTAPPSTDEAIGEVERAICKKPRDLIEARELKNSEVSCIKLQLLHFADYCKSDHLSTFDASAAGKGDL